MRLGFTDWTKIDYPDGYMWVKMLKIKTSDGKSYGATIALTPQEHKNKHPDELDPDIAKAKVRSFCRSILSLMEKE